MPAYVDDQGIRSGAILLTACVRCAAMHTLQPAGVATLVLTAIEALANPQTWEAFRGGPGQRLPKTIPEND
jgi:hypothetical protein